MRVAVAALVGVEWANYFMPFSWLTLDADLAYSPARFRDPDPAGRRIPGAVEGVASAGILVEGSLRVPSLSRRRERHRY